MQGSSMNPTRVRIKRKLTNPRRETSFLLGLDETDQTAEGGSVTRKKTEMLGEKEVGPGRG